MEIFIRLKGKGYIKINNRLIKDKLRKRNIFKGSIVKINEKSKIRLITTRVSRYCIYFEVLCNKKRASK